MTGVEVRPTHHIPEDLLLEAVAGAIEPALGLAVDCHVALCAHCLDERRRLLEIGGALLESEVPYSVSADALANVLARLDQGGERSAPPRRAAAPPSLAGLLPFDPPAALARCLAAAPHRHWRYVAPGTRGIDVPVGASSSTAHLLRLRPGLRIPRHDHAATEATLVFTGALHDSGQRFGAGDILFRTPGDEHKQEVDHAESCIALVVNVGKLVPRTLKGRLLQLIARP